MYTRRRRREGHGYVRLGGAFFSRWWDFSEGRSGKGKGKGKEGVRKKDGVVHSGRLEREKQSGGGGDGVTSSDNASLFVNFLFHSTAHFYVACDERDGVG